MTNEAIDHTSIPEFAQAFNKAIMISSAFRDIENLTSEDIAEPVANIEMSAECFAQLLMQRLPDGERMSTSDKHFWLKVLDWMGPDYRDSFRKVGGFMAKVDEF